MLKISRGHWRGCRYGSSVRRERQSRASRSSAGHVLSDDLDKDRQPKPILEREAGSESGRKFAGGRSTQRRAGKVNVLFPSNEAGLVFFEHWRFGRRGPIAYSFGSTLQTYPRRDNFSV